MTLKRKPVDLPSAQRAVRALLEALGVDVDADPELRDTPRRVAEAWGQELLAGYDADPKQILSNATAATTRDLVVLSGIAVTTMCPHHLLPSSGVAHVGYVPDGRVVGLGALAQLVDAFARRLQLQENLGAAVAEALVSELGARAGACVLDLVPMCVAGRGERQHDVRCVTVSYAGTWTPDDRQAFLGASRFDSLQGRSLNRSG